MSQITANTVELKEFIMGLFSNQPQPVNSFCLELEPQILSATNEEDKNKIIAYKNNLLMSIFINGARILFGNEVTPTNISDRQFTLLNTYMQSIGYNCKYEYVKNKQGVNTNIDIWFEYIQ